MLIQTLISECSQAPASLDEETRGAGFCESAGLWKPLNFTAAVLFVYVATGMSSEGAILASRSSALACVTSPGNQQLNIYI